MIKKLMRGIGRRIPGAGKAYRTLVRAPLEPQSVEDRFTAIYRSNAWRGAASVSGPGSDAEQTAVVAVALSNLVRERGVASVLDVPCGDFHWMQNVDLGAAHYTGGDIVTDLVESNQRRFGSASRDFCKINLLEDRLPPAELIFCRDCLVHFSNTDVLRALRNIARSKATYLLTTTFTARNNAVDIVTGQWRPLNLRAEPFALPEPLELIVEHCTEDQGRYHDKAIGLWRVADIARAIG